MAETDEDREAWTRLVGGVEAPVLKVGEQSMRGYAPAAWDETLNVAGYPRQSLLPVNYTPPAAVPLAERRAAPPPRAPAPTAAPAVDSATNPSGIRF